MKKNLFLTLACAIGLSLSAAFAQSITINYGNQAAFNTSDVKTFRFANSNNDLRLTKANNTAVTYPVKEITSVEFSNEPANLVQKYADGEPAPIVFNCLEVNNVNPLVTLNYTLKKTGKYLFDAVVLFSSNINYSQKEDVVYLHNNENVEPILLHADKYIKPLKEKGIKVLLSILGNHDCSGICNLGPERSKAFAQAIADTCAKYNLDGVFFDDEYSNYGTQGTAKGFVQNSYSAASRFIYDVKQAIGPDRWTVIYRWGGISSLVAVDGHNPGEYLDFVLSNYNVNTDQARFYPGITKAQQGVNSISMNSPWSVESNMQFVRKQKYGALLVYNLTPYNSSYASTQKPALDAIAKTLYDDEIVYGTGDYRKDWKTMDWLREPNR
ncbi:MAG: glycosyl hydrolase family 18 protein [Bacteroidaceae bacterium]|nr:glycosyl hydrolase family 18 protein [Bacteroidaceae bacterium]